VKNVLILDTETTGLDPKTGHLLEVGAVLWSVKYRSIVRVFSTLYPANGNPAESVNGIPASLLLEQKGGPDALASFEVLQEMVVEADAVVAHNADFDRQWYPLSCPWICTIEDFVWPKPSPSKSLTALALAHGCAVVSAHRAIHDCLLLARCFEAIPDVDARLDAALRHALLPKVEVISLAPFEEKDVVKEHGFHWDPARKVWHRTMALADAEKLPFRTRAAAK